MFWKRVVLKISRKNVWYFQPEYEFLQPRIFAVLITTNRLVEVAY